MSVLSGFHSLFRRPHLWVIATIGVIVPRRLRADWREEWEAELRYREERLAEWDRLNGRDKWELLRRSSSAFWDALCLQRQRREDEVIQDLRFGIRMLLKSPTFTSVAVLTLGLGIGANTAVFTFVNALLLRPLPGVAEPDRLLQLGRQFPDKPYVSDSSYPEYLDYRDQNTSLSGLAAFAPSAFHIRTGTQTERVEGELVTGNYFDVLGTPAAFGRLLSPADDSANDLVAVISHRLWQRRFGSNPSVLGSTIKVNGQDFTLVGVVAEPFAGVKIGSPRDLWVPLTSLRRTDPKIAARFDDRRPSWLEMFGRVAPGVSFAQAQADLMVIGRRAYPSSPTRIEAGVVPGLGLDSDVRRELRRFTYLPLAAVAAVLLIACANVAGLLLSRAADRRKEIATRIALGAGRVRVTRQLLTESLVLAIAGGCAGLAIGGWLTSSLRALLPDRYLFLSFNLDFGLDWRVFLFTLAIATATGLVFGLVPALQSTRPELVPALKEGRLPAGRRLFHVRSLLVITQLALSVVLLVAAGLCARTLGNAIAIDKGYDAESVLTARMDLGKQNYTRTRGLLLEQELLGRMQAVPGVDAAAFAFTLPLNDSRWEEGIRREGDPTRVQTFQNAVSPRYFEVMRIPLVAGRVFSDADGETAPPVAIVNQTLARTLWPDSSPVGRRLSANGRSVEIVGVMRDIKGRNLLEAASPILFLPLAQAYQPNIVLHVRSSVPPMSLVEPLRRELHALDADLPFYGVSTMDQHVTATLTPQRLLAYLVGGFGVVALLLAGIGLYGLLAYTVTQRTPEIGLRMALGASKADVVRLFVGGAMRLTLVGLALGCLVTVGVTPMMKSVLFGVRPLDPVTLATATGLLLLAALVASAVPARRAAGADPKEALRYE